MALSFNSATKKWERSTTTASSGSSSTPQYGGDINQGAGTPRSQTTPVSTTPSYITPGGQVGSSINPVPKPVQDPHSNEIGGSGIDYGTSQFVASGGNTLSRTSTSITQQAPAQTTKTNQVTDTSRYTQQNPSDESLASGLGNPLKKKKKQYDQFGNEIVTIANESGQQQGTPQVGSDAWMQEKQRAEAEKQVNEQLLQPLDREMTMFDRGQENLDINQQRSQEQLDLEKQRALEDRQVQLENTRRDVARNIEDTSKARSETMQKLEKTAAVMGINAVSTYYDTYQKTMDKFNTSINRVQEDLGQYETQMGVANDRLNQDYDRSVKNMMSDYLMNTKRLQEDFNYSTRQYRDYMIREANVMVEKYGLSSEKLGDAIQTISLNAFKAVNDAYGSYLSNIDTQTDILDKQVNNVINTRTNMMKYEEDLIKNYVDSSGNLTINDLNAMVTRGEMSPQNAQNALSKVLDMAINTIDSASMEGVGSLFQDQIVEGLNAGFTPNQIIQNILKSTEYKEAVQQIASADPFFATKLKQAQLQNQKEEADINYREKQNTELDLENQKASTELLDAIIAKGGPSGIAAYSQKKRGKTNLQCGELVNDYWTQMTGSRAGMGDTYASKVAAIDKAGRSTIPMEGGMFAQNIGPNGHTGIVMSVNDDGSISVLEANAGGTKEGSAPTMNTYSAETVKGMVFSQPPIGGTQQQGDQGIIGSLGVPVSYERRIKNMVPATLMNSEVELEQLNETIKKLYEAGATPEKAMLTYLGVDVKPEHEKFTSEIINRARGLTEVPNNFYSSISDFINKGRKDLAIGYLEREGVRQSLKDNPDLKISESGATFGVTQAKNILALMDKYESQYGPLKGSWEKMTKGIFGNKEAQELATAMTQAIVKMQKDLAGSDITLGEQTALKDLIPTLSETADTARVKVENLKNTPLLQYNIARSYVGLPELTVDTLLDKKKRVSLYDTGGSVTPAPVDIKTTVDRFSKEFGDSPSAENF